MARIGFSCRIGARIDKGFEADFFQPRKGLIAASSRRRFWQEIDNPIAPKPATLLKVARNGLPPLNMLTLSGPAADEWDVCPTGGSGVSAQAESIRDVQNRILSARSLQLHRSIFSGFPGT